MPQMRQYQIDRSAWSKRYDLQPLFPSGEPLSVDISVWTNPALVLHRGPKLAGPIISVAHFPKLSSSVQVALGDPADPKTAKWADITRASRTRGESSFTLPVGRGGAPCTFSWKRTHNVAAEGHSVGMMSSRHLKMVDQQGNVVAIYTHEGWSSKGTLQLNAQIAGGDLETMAIMSCLAIREKDRRRRTAGAASAGAGAST